MVAEQLPQWSGRAVRPVTSHGTVHQLYRLGDDLVLRFPLNPGDVAETRAWLRAEADAARSLLGRLPVPTPEPVALGEPGQGYPLPWVVYRWLPGEVPTRGSVALARDLAEVVRALRGIDTGGRRFAGAGRGGVLAEADEYVAAYLDDAEGMIDTDALRRLWSRLSRTPRDLRRRLDARGPDAREPAGPGGSAGRGDRRRGRRSGRSRARPPAGLEPARRVRPGASSATRSGSTTTSGTAAGRGRSRRRSAAWPTTASPTRRCPRPRAAPWTRCSPMSPPRPGGPPRHDVHHRPPVHLPGRLRRRTRPEPRRPDRRAAG